MSATSMDQLVALCKRRGFIFPSSQLYGGLQGVYDFGPLGVEIKNHLKQRWWRDSVYYRSDVEGLDSSILTHRQVLQYSGHEDTFTDPMIDCKTCKSRWRSDHISDQCPACGGSDLTEPRDFNLMFSTQVGPVKKDDALAYLRPETAQGIFANFKHIVDSTSRKLPFGIAQIGKAFRNEITPKNFIFRVREFEQMELEFFIDKKDDAYWHDYWVEKRYQWWRSQGLSADNLQLEKQGGDDLSHYSKATTDILYQFPHGFEEIEGIANRTDYDCGSHSKDQSACQIDAKVKNNTHSTQRLAIQDMQTQQWQVPYCIEPSAGVERGVLAVLCEAYCEEQEPVKRTVLKIAPHLAPIKAAVIPLARNKPELVSKAREIETLLRQKSQGRILFENTGNIGKAYRRHDEIGTPLCLTVDFDTIESGDQYDSVTIRHRDTCAQERIPIERLKDYFSDYYSDADSLLSD